MSLDPCLDVKSLTRLNPDTRSIGFSDTGYSDTI